MQRMKVSLTLKNGYQMNKHLPNLNFNCISLIYLTGSVVVIFNSDFFMRDRFFPIVSILLSITFLFCAYQNNKIIVNKLVGTSIVKWVSTVCVFSVCLWYSKHKLNFDYDIEAEYLNYSAYGYAFAMAIPLCLFIYGLCIFMYVYLGKVTAYQSFYSAIITLIFCYLLQDFINNLHGVDFTFGMGVTLFFPYGFIMLLRSIKKINKNNIAISKKRTINIKMIKAIFKAWFKKHLASVNDYLKITDLLSIVAALIYIATFSFGIIPEYQSSFLLLDAFYKTDCNDKKDSFLYLRKSNSECYRVTFNNFEVTRMESFHSPH